MLFDPQQGLYFSLNPQAAATWQLLDEPRTVEDLVDRLRSQFRDGGRDVEGDVLAFLAVLERHTLIEISTDPR